MMIDPEVACGEKRNWAMIAGINYLCIFGASITANFFVFERLLVSGNIAESMNNIQQHDLLFRWGIGLWMLTMVFDTVVAWALYQLFKPTHPTISLLAGTLRVVFVALFCYSILADISLLNISMAANSEDALPEFYLLQGNMHLQNAYYGVRISYLFFGWHIALVGYLALRSRSFPIVIPVLLFIAAGGYVVDSFSNVLFPAYRHLPNIFMIVVGIPALLAELSLTMWLLFKFGRKGVSR